MNRLLIKNALLINEGKRFKADVLIEGERIKSILTPDPSPCGEGQGVGWIDFIRSPSINTLAWKRFPSLIIQAFFISNRFIFFADIS